MVEALGQRNRASRCAPFTIHTYMVASFTSDTATPATIRSGVSGLYISTSSSADMITFFTGAALVPRVIASSSFSSPAVHFCLQQYSKSGLPHALTNQFPNPDLNPLVLVGYGRRSSTLRPLPRIGPYSTIRVRDLAIRQSTLPPILIPTPLRAP